MQGGVYPSRKEENDFFISLGKAITEWAHIEEELYEITAAVLDTTRELASIVFYRTPTIDSRLTLTDDCVKTLFPNKQPGDHDHPYLKTWRKLQGDIRLTLNTQNRLAHHPASPVVDVWQSKENGEITFSTRHASHISESERLRKKDQPFDPLDIDDIRKHLQAISQFINRLRNFRHGELAFQLRVCRLKTSEDYQDRES